MMITAEEAIKHIARQAKARRLLLNLSQKSLSERSGVSYGTLKKFESTGKISLESLLKLALILDNMSDFEHLFAAKPLESFLSLDEVMKEKTRKRGRK